MTHQAILDRVTVSGLPIEHAEAIAAHLAQLGERAVDEAIMERRRQLERSAGNNGENSHHGFVQRIAFGDRAPVDDRARYVTVYSDRDVHYQYSNRQDIVDCLARRDTALAFHYPADGAVTTVPAADDGSDSDGY